MSMSTSNSANNDQQAAPPPGGKWIMPTAKANAHVRLFIAGEFRASGSGRMFDNVSPLDGRVIGRIHEASPADVAEAVTAARAALDGPWGKLTVDERSRMLHAVAAGIEARFDEFLDAEIADTGKPVSLASHIDIPRGAANFRVFADLVKAYPDEFYSMRTPVGAGAINYVTRKPKGVIGVICPWNLPLLLMTWKVGPALACGNTVVVKPSEMTPTTATLLGEVMQQVGIPPGVYNVVHGFGQDSAGEWLTHHPGVDAITFTGETTTGEAIMRAASRGVRDISLELGGKNPSLIFADCNLDKAIEGTLRSAFANCGQVCLGTERIYVERPIFQAFCERLVKGAERLKPGLPGADGVNFGPLISEEHRQKVLGYYAQARDQGANVLTGGGIPANPQLPAGGAWIEPTIWTGLPETSAVLREEIFGPCCHITPFDDEAEAIRLANDTPYGLAACIWTENLSRAHRLAAQLDVGITWVNSWFLRDLRTAFGGAKQSGIGREGGTHGLAFYTEIRNVCVQM